MSDSTPVISWDDPDAPRHGNQRGIAPRSRYRPARTLARIALVLVGMTTLLYVIDGLLSIYGVMLLGDLDHVTDAQLMAYDDVAALVALASAALYVLAGISVLAWVRRAVSNIPPLTGDDAGPTPNMAVIWWFIPFANFVKPYQIVADVWRRLAPTVEQERTGRVGWWWAGFIFGNLLATIYGRMPPPTSVEEFNGLANLNVASDVLIVMSGALLVGIISEIEFRSTARAALVTQGGPSSTFAAELARHQPYDSKLDRPSYDTPASALPLGPPQG